MDLTIRVNFKNQSRGEIVKLDDRENVSEIDFLKNGLEACHHWCIKDRSLRAYPYLPTPPLGQIMTQGQFQAEFNRFECRVFLLLD